MAPPHADVVLLSTPFYRCLGSHNDKAPLALSYLSTALTAADVDHVVLNGDCSGAATYWSIRHMMADYRWYCDAVDGRSSLYGEVAEQVMSFQPSVVIVMGAEPLVPSTEWGNPFIAARFGRLFRELGCYTVGLGPYLTLDSARFVDSFDCIAAGEPSRTVVEIVERRPTGVVTARPMALDALPTFERFLPREQRTDVVLTSFGCSHRCTFCVSGQLSAKLGQPTRLVETEMVIEDIARRPIREIYLGDLNLLAASNDRLEALRGGLTRRGVDKSFTCDGRVADVTDDKAGLLKAMGVRAVKLGIETVRQEQLDAYHKQTTLAQCERAIACLRRHDVDVIFYLLIGPDTTAADYEETRRFVDRWRPLYVVPNVWAYDITTDYRYDTQFSPLRLQALGVDVELFHRFLDLQSALNPTVGKIIDVPSPS